jgi:hypothetical protein
MTASSISGEDLKKGGFTRSIGADHAIAIPAGELHIHLVKEHALAKL